ncbi:NAD(P)-binding protein [Trichoderma evansii]
MLPENYSNRPVTVLGGGVLGRRIACIWASAGYDVQIREPNQSQHEPCLDYIKINAAKYPAAGNKPTGTVRIFQDLDMAVQTAWLVIEAVPENIQMKIDTFAELETHAPKDAILASNSSSYKSSEMLEKIEDATKSRVLNTHYYMPPENMVVELMTDGYTDPEIFPFLMDRQREVGCKPFFARKECTGFIFNRLWAAIKRETLSILAEGVSTPEEIDTLCVELTKSWGGPCRFMDVVGLDTVALIEDHYIKERQLSPTNTVDFLRREYISKGKLGAKSPYGGLYPPQTKSIALDSAPAPGTQNIVAQA